MTASTRKTSGRLKLAVTEIQVLTATLASPEGSRVYPYSVGDIYAIGSMLMPAALANNALATGWGSSSDGAPNVSDPVNSNMTTISAQVGTKAQPVTLTWEGL